MAYGLQHFQVKPRKNIEKYNTRGVDSVLSKKLKMEVVDKSNLNAEILTQLKSYVYDIVGCCQEVHRELGPWQSQPFRNQILVVFSVFLFQGC